MFAHSHSCTSSALGFRKALRLSRPKSRAAFPSAAPVSRSGRAFLASPAVALTRGSSPASASTTPASSSSLPNSYTKSGARRASIAAWLEDTRHEADSCKLQSGEQACKVSMNRFLISSELDLSEYGQIEGHHVQTSARSKLSIVSVRTRSQAPNVFNCLIYGYTTWCRGKGVSTF